jgi:Predicted transcriptional regulators
MKLNEKIAWYRRERKLSQEELAARVGVSRQAVSKWELGVSHS